MLKICNDKCEITYKCKEVTVTIKLDALPERPSKKLLREYFEYCLTGLGCPEHNSWEVLNVSDNQSL